jgi:group I intron endonuclease
MAESILSKNNPSGFLYRLTFPNGKAYIGITSRTAKARFKEHCKNAASGRGIAVSRAITKYGHQSVVVETLLSATWDYLLFIEPLVIELYGTKGNGGYNLSAGGEGVIGVVPTPETRELLRQANLGKKHSESTIEKMRASHKTAVWTPESRARLGHMKGKKPSEKTIEKIRIANTGRRQTPDQIEKLRVASTGRVRPPHEVEKIRAAMLGRVMTTEHKENLRRSSTGRVMSKESIEKQWATRRANSDAKRLLAQ